MIRKSQYNNIKYLSLSSSSLFLSFSVSLSLSPFLSLLFLILSLPFFFYSSSLHVSLFLPSFSLPISLSSLSALFSLLLCVVISHCHPSCLLSSSPHLSLSQSLNFFCSVQTGLQVNCWETAHRKTNTSQVFPAGLGWGSKIRGEGRDVPVVCWSDLEEGDCKEGGWQLTGG